MLFFSFVLLPIDGLIGDDDEYWLIRARYHLRNEEYWKNRTYELEKELDALKCSIRREKRILKKSREVIEREDNSL